MLYDSQTASRFPSAASILPSIMTYEFPYEQNHTKYALFPPESYIHLPFFSPKTLAYSPFFSPKTLDSSPDPHSQWRSSAASPTARISSPGGAPTLRLVHRKHDSIAGAPSLSKLVQQRRFGSGLFNASLPGSRPDFSFSSTFLRHMSTANGGSPNDTKLVADALSDTTLQASASQIPALDEVAVAAADSFFVSAWLQQLIAGIHVFCGFNWWASTIALQTVFIRLTVLPLAVTNLRSSSLMRLPLKWIFIQVPVFTSFFIAINNMAPWFVDSSHINSPPEEVWILAQEIKKASEGCLRPVVFLIYCVGLLQSLTGFEC